MSSKTCTKCKKSLPLDDFYPSKSAADRLHPWCRSCTLEKNKQYYKDVKQEMIDAYGGKCVCCGENRPEFLTIDHISDNGRMERDKYLKYGSSFYHLLRKRGFPSVWTDSDGTVYEYALSCYNCNCARGTYGYCPHSKEM